MNPIKDEQIKLEWMKEEFIKECVRMIGIIEKQKLKIEREEEK